jgi:hypothetical protein
MCSNDAAGNPPSVLGIIKVLLIYVVFVFILFALTAFVFTKMGFTDAQEQSFVAGVSAFLGAVVAIMLDRILKYFGLS